MWHSTWYLINTNLTCPKTSCLSLPPCQLILKSSPPQLRTAQLFERLRAKTLVAILTLLLPSHPTSHCYTVCSKSFGSTFNIYRTWLQNFHHVYCHLLHVTIKSYLNVCNILLTCRLLLIGLLLANTVPLCKLGKKVFLQDTYFHLPEHCRNKYIKPWCVQCHGLPLAVACLCCTQPA